MENSKMRGFLLPLCLIAMTLFFAGCEQKVGSPVDSKLNVVLIVVDTLGARHLQAYDSRLNNSPHIAKLAQEGVLFRNAYSVAPWTKPAIASIFTSLLPSEHKLRDLHDKLSTEQLTMAELLKLRGYATMGKVSHTFLNEKQGFSQGFDSFEVVPFRGNVHHAITSETVSTRALRWLEQHQKESAKKPFFMFLHYFDPHYNYQHHPQFDRTSKYKGKLQPGTDIRELRRLIPELTKEDIQYLVDLYHEEIQFTDHHIGRVIDDLKKRGLDSNTLVILTADHGEEFMEHDFIGHTRTLYDELVNIPLIFWLPGKLKPAEIKENVSALDILPTVLALENSESALSSKMSGVSLLPTLLQGREVAADREILFEVDFRSSGIKANQAGVKREKLKVIYDKPSQNWALHDLERDPFELNDQKSQYPADLQALQKILESLMSKQGQQAEPVSSVASPEEVEQLKSLGYM
jgi:arylsulfatase A-like enzyme